jgi:hypothetical protein
MGEAKRRKALDPNWGTTPHCEPVEDVRREPNRRGKSVFMAEILRNLIDADLDPSATARLMRTLAGRDSE